MIKRYILLKDLPDVNAGTELRLNHDGTLYFILVDHTNLKLNSYAYPKDFVEKNPKWFKEVEETILTAWFGGRQYVEISAIDKARKEAFEAARKLQWGGTVSGYMGEGLTFKTFADYYNSLQR